MCHTTVVCMTRSRFSKDRLSLFPNILGCCAENIQNKNRFTIFEKDFVKRFGAEMKRFELLRRY